MRITEEERKALRHALAGVEGTAYLYGSRIDPGRKGGDIDLLVLARSASPYRMSQAISRRFRMACDERIDVLVVDPERIPPEQEAFISLVRRDAVRLP